MQLYVIVVFIFLLPGDGIRFVSIKNVDMEEDKMKPFLVNLILFIFLLTFVQCGGGYKLRGVVYDAELKAVPEAKVVVQYNSGRDSLVTYSDEQGNFVLKGIKTKEAKIFVRSPNFIPLQQDFVFKNSEEVTQLKLVYRPTRIIGRVICAKTKQPLPRVKVTETVSEVSVLTDQNGRFVIDRGLDPDLDQELTFNLANYNRTSLMVKAKLHRDVDVGDVLLSPLPGFDPTLQSEAQDQLGNDDRPILQDAMGARGTGRLEDFLMSHEKFTFAQFKKLLDEIRANNTEENTRKNLEYYLQEGWIEEIEPGLYLSKRYNPNP